MLPDTYTGSLSNLSRAALSLEQLREPERDCQGQGPSEPLWPWVVLKRQSWEKTERVSSGPEESSRCSTAPPSAQWGPLDYRQAYWRCWNTFPGVSGHSVVWGCQFWPWISVHSVFNSTADLPEEAGSRVLLGPCPVTEILLTFSSGMPSGVKHPAGPNKRKIRRPGHWVRKCITLLIRQLILWPIKWFPFCYLQHWRETSNNFYNKWSCYFRHITQKELYF